VKIFFVGLTILPATKNLLFLKNSEQGKAGMAPHWGTKPYRENSKTGCPVAGAAIDRNDPARKAPQPFAEIPVVSKRARPRREVDDEE
jgi:hypothetical protein